MALKDIPQTEARLSQSVEIRMVIPVQVNLGVAFSYQLQPGTTIGTIQKLIRNQDRKLYRRFTLGTNAFEPWDIIPGNITTSLTLEKVVLYQDTLLGAPIDGDALALFGFIGGNMIYQQSAFDIQEISHPPDGSDPTITTYKDIWFKTNPITYDVSTAEAKPIIQSVEVWVGAVTTSTTISKLLVPLVKSLLPNGFNF